MAWASRLFLRAPAGLTDWAFRAIGFGAELGQSETTDQWGDSEINTPLHQRVIGSLDDVQG